MKLPPRYFEAIRQRAAKRWEQLESDPELAGPWHQLFKQVQSPRHILSELLQNADDAGATSAYVYIKDGMFSFGHDGEDFTEENFASLCRFGYSNKRALHTIGFRGIGFKSTFSLGNRVELHTPTLSVAFDQLRFTEPIWIPEAKSDGETQVRVAVADQYRQRDVEKNLEEWLKSPFSLLFFRHLRRFQIQGHDLHWRTVAPGPVVNSEWMELGHDAKLSFLIARSSPETFPDEALVEIKQERMLIANEDAHFPPCQVEIVLGAKGRLFVVLPTGVETTLPFACNAPFIQDPSRLKIKDPGLSPTNRWLLDRAGRLAASVMLGWLERPDIASEKRSRAYELLPDVDREDSSLEGLCATAVEEALAAALEGKALLLTDDDRLVPAQGSVIIPRVLFDVWPSNQAAALLDDSARPPLSRNVSEASRRKLANWGLIDEIAKANVLDLLRRRHFPRPANWLKLLHLWSYVAPELTRHYQHASHDVRIVPVHGKDVLYAANEVVRLGERRLLQSDEDWNFLSEYLVVLNQNWPRFLAEQRRAVEDSKDQAIREYVEAPYAVLRAIGLEDSSDIDEIVERVASSFFKRDRVTLADSVRLGRIAAKLGANPGKALRVVSRDRNFRSRDDVVVYDPTGALEALLPADWCDTHLLHPAYSQSSSACSDEEWERWISSGRAGIHTFPPLTQHRLRIWGRQNLEQELRTRGFDGELSYPYVTYSFVIDDWDLEEGHWTHWEGLAAEGQRVWGQIAERILAQAETFWSKASTARALQIATTGSLRSVTQEPLTPGWILKLRALSCLPDTRGFYRKPSDLMRRTPETESLIDVEPFIRSSLDTEANRPLLRMLGVRETPTGPDRILDCLRALALSDSPPIQEVERWYRRLDQMMDHCSTSDVATIKRAFHEEKILLTDAGWTQASGAFLSSDEEDVPGAAVVRASVRDLTLWRRIGVADRPTADLAIQWLKGLPSNAALSQEDARRVRALLARYPVRVWSECHHWTNLAAEWVPVETLSYALAMQSLVPWSNLHEWVKQKTGDLQRLTSDVVEAPPFAALPALAGQIEDRFHRRPTAHGRPEKKPWLSCLGQGLTRVKLESESETARVRALAERLSQTLWQTAPELEIIPYIAGTPAGTPRRADVVWLEAVIYADDRPMAKLARAIAQELGRAFQRQDIVDAIKICFDRSPEFVTEYLHENFALIAADPELMAEAEKSVSTTPTETESNTGKDGAHEASLTVDVSAEEEPASLALAEEVGANDQNADLAGANSEPKEPGDEQSATDSVAALPEKERPVRKPPKPNIIERFAQKCGYQKESDDRFFHEDGSWIAKSRENPFPWERHSAAGEILCSYLPKDHCLELEPLQLEADVWGLAEKFPDTCALILADPRDEPVAVSGKALRAMRDAGKLTLYPATYRLVYRDDRER